MKELRERIAKLEHEQWAHWTDYMLNNLTPENMIRWRRQIDTPYSELSEKEKDSDRSWADKAIALIPKPTVWLPCDKCKGYAFIEHGLSDPKHCEHCTDGKVEHLVTWWQELDMGGVDPQNRPLVTSVDKVLELPDLLDVDMRDALWILEGNIKDGNNAPVIAIYNNLGTLRIGPQGRCIDESRRNDSTRR